MKQASTIFLQAAFVILAILALVFMILLPLNEGRAENLDWLHIYLDPFILYGFASSIVFFIGLYKGFRLLGYIRKNEIFSLKSLDTLKRIKHCAILLCILIVLAGLYIKLFHHKEDDPAGFLGICIITAFASIVVAASTSIFENIINHALEIKLENERLKK